MNRPDFHSHAHPKAPGSRQPLRRVVAGALLGGIASVVAPPALAQPQPVIVPNSGPAPIVVPGPTPVVIPVAPAPVAPAPISAPPTSAPVIAAPMAGGTTGPAAPLASWPSGGAAAPTQAGQVTLLDALTQAYERNPDLLAARAQLRATDEQVGIVRAQGLPSLQGAAQFNHTLNPGLNNPVTPENQFTASGTASLPIYMGGTVGNAISAAKQRVIAGRHDVDAEESGVFTQVVSAYLAVIHDEAVVRLNASNLDALGVNLKATDARFQKGDLTKTDVAQSNQRLEQARAQLFQAQVTLNASRERYVRLVGVAPGVLAPPQPLTGLPMGIDEAIDVALRNNPDLLSADVKARAAHYDTRAARGTRLPRITGYGSIQYNNYFGGYGGVNSNQLCQVSPTSFLPCFPYQQEHTASVGAQMTIPLYQGGGPAAQVRQAQAKESAALETANGVNRAVIENTRAAYYAWRASSSIIASSEAAVASAEQSLTGVRAENKIGTRTILDVLNAEQELLSAQVQLVSARRDAYVAAFSLLAAMGEATARNVGIDSSQIYDSTAHYRRVGGSIWDWGSDPAPVAQSTTTRIVPVQDGLLR